MLKQNDKISVEIPLLVAWTPEATFGRATMKYEDCTTHVVDDNDAEVGAVSAGVGCTVDVRVNQPDGKMYTYRLSPEDIWRAVVKLHNAANGQSIPLFENEVADCRLLSLR